MKVGGAGGWGLGVGGGGLAGGGVGGVGGARASFSSAKPGLRTQGGGEK